MSVVVPNNLSSAIPFAGKYCMEPFITIHIKTSGVVSMCPCPGWGRTQIGNILETSLDAMLASPLAQKIRQSIIDGSYTYCNKTQCGILVNDLLNTKDSLPPNVLELLEDSTKFNMPYDIRIDGDRTCNLSCPSCRTGIIKLNDDEVLQQEKISLTLYKNLFSKPTDQPIHVSVSGAGEIFGSPMLLNFLSQIKLSDFPNFTLEIHTNGLLSKRFWHKIAHLESVITHLTVSIDAACADTYEQVRRGGKWIELLNNLEFLQAKKYDLNFKFCARMIVQQTNYNEILEFYKFCKLYDIDRVEYSRITDWNTWSKYEFHQHDVLNKLHAGRSQALALINLVKQYPDTWFQGNFE